MMIDAVSQRVFVFLGLAAVVVGCAQPRPFDDLWVEARPYRADLPAVRPPSAAMDGKGLAAAAQGFANPDGVISLHEAVALALRHSPELKAAGWSVAAAEADAMQLARPHNPTATLGVENFGGPDRLQELPRQTLRISQVIELAGKRDKRKELGRAEQRLQAWDYERQRLETAATTAARYVAVLVSQRRVALAEQQLKLAEAAYAVADDRANNGTRPGYERDQAATRVALSRIQQQRTDQGLAADRADLAASWGAEQASFEHVDGELTHRYDLPPIDTLRKRLPQSPHLARWGDVIARHERAVELQRANAVTDPSLGGGVRYLSELDETVGVAEVSWPLPLLDNNGHGVLAARLRLSQARAQRDAAQAETSRLLTRAYTRVIAASETLAALEKEAIPAATAAYDAARQAYEAGQAEYLTALDAERSLLDLQGLRLDAAQAYHTAIIDLEHLTASPIQPALRQTR